MRETIRKESPARHAEISLLSDLWGGSVDEFAEGIAPCGVEAGAMLDMGNGVIELFANAEPGRKPGQVDHIALATDKVDDCMAVCAKEGLKVIMAPQDIVVPCETPYPLRIAFVEGKAGEIIEFFDEKQERR